MEKKEAGKKLYMQGVSQVDIASLLSVDKKTVNLWVKKGNWEDKRIEQDLAKETAQEEIMNLINYQLKVIGFIKKRHEENLMERMEVKELKALLIERGDIDALQKLFTTIKGKELEWDSIVKVIRGFIEYIETIDIAIAKTVAPLASDYLNERRKEL